MGFTFGRRFHFGGEGLGRGTNFSKLLIVLLILLVFVVMLQVDELFMSFPACLSLPSGILLVSSFSLCIFPNF